MHTLLIDKHLLQHPPVHLTSLKLPEDFGKNVKTRWQIRLRLDSSIERLSVHKNMREFTLHRDHDYNGFVILPARELIRNRSPDSDGVFRIRSRRPLLIEAYGFQPTLTMTRKADGVEIGWEAGTLHPFS